MNTFLSTPDFRAAVRVLPHNQLNKQRSEALAILRALTGVNNGYRFHPATLMWEGCTVALFWYLQCVVTEWMQRGNEDNGTISKALHCVAPYCEGQGSVIHDDFTLKHPWWLGQPAFHQSHAAIVRWKTKPVGTKPVYVWPIAANRWKVVDDLLEVRKSKWVKLPPDVRLIRKLRRPNDPILTTTFLLGANRAQLLLEGGAA